MLPDRPGFGSRLVQSRGAKLQYSQSPKANGMSDRWLRSLVHLEANASTARTLNLTTVWKRHGETDEYKAKPFFRSVQLNRSMIVKHRLRYHERDVFNDDRTSATKVILPIVLTDMRSGARSFFVGQRNYEDFMAELAPDGERSPRDDNLLRALDTLPSLDPFLMRERLRKDGIEPARCYFDLTEADAARMFSFVRQEVMPLIGMSFNQAGQADEGVNNKVTKLATKLLADASDAALEPLRAGMGMGPGEFEEGVFCWKGFIYYKWTLGDLLPRVRPTALEIAAVTPKGPVTSDEKVYIAAARVRLAKSIGRICETVAATLKTYDEAYAELTRNGKPQAFKSFLLKAPSMFHDLGERLGAVQHIISFWRFRFPSPKSPKLTADELVDLLTDFEASLEFDDTLAL